MIEFQPIKSLHLFKQPHTATKSGKAIFLINAKVTIKVIRSLTLAPVKFKSYSAGSSCLNPTRGTTLGSLIVTAGVASFDGGYAWLRLLLSSGGGRGGGGWWGGGIHNSY